MVNGVDEHGDAEMKNGQEQEEVGDSNLNKLNEKMRKMSCEEEDLQEAHHEKEANGEYYVETAAVQG